MIGIIKFLKQLKDVLQGLIDWFGNQSKRGYFLLSLCLLAILVLPSCKRIATSQMVEGTSVSPAALDTIQEGTPISSADQAVLAALSGVATTRLKPLATPQAEVVEQLTHGAALERVGHAGAADDPAYPDDLDVWLVVFEGEWSLTPPMSTALPPFHGCVFAILTAAQGHNFNVGTCPCSLCKIHSGGT